MEIHPSHVPAEPKDIGLGRGLVYCRSCGWLLWSASGPSKGRKAYQPCNPATIDFRDSDRWDNEGGA